MFVIICLVLFLQVGFEKVPEADDTGYNFGGVIMMVTEDFISVNETPVKIDKVHLEVYNEKDEKVSLDSLKVPFIARLLIQKEKKDFVVKKIKFMGKFEIKEEIYEDLGRPSENGEGTNHSSPDFYWR